MDIKKLGPIPHGGGWRIHGRAKAQKLSKNTKPGYGYIHHALDDHSRLAYSEILEDDKKETASAFWIRTNQYFESCGINMKRVMTDDGSVPETAVPAARNLLKQGCVALIGNFLSNSRISIAYQVADPAGVPYLNFSFYEGNISTPTFFHFAALPNQQIDLMIPYLVEHDGPKFFLAGNDYEWPRGSLDAVRGALEPVNGEVVAEDYYPLGEADVEELIAAVSRSGADVFVPYFAGYEQAAVIREFAGQGLRRRMAFATGHCDEQLMSALKPDERAGYYSSNTYFMSVDSPESRDFLTQLAQRPEVHGIWPEGSGIGTNFAEGALVCVLAFAEAARIAESPEPEAVISQLPRVRVAAPQGVVAMDSATQHPDINGYLTRSLENGTFEILLSEREQRPIIPKRYKDGGIERPARSASPVPLGQENSGSLNLSDLSDILDVETASVAVDDEGRIRYVNRTAKQMFGYLTDELIGQRIGVLIPPRFRSSHGRYVADFQGEEDGAIAMGSRTRIYGYTKSGGEFEAEAAVVRTRVDEVPHSVAMLRQLRAGTGPALELRWQYHHDPLTGLPNRTAMTERLQGILRRAWLSQGTTGVLFVDVDHFKLINDTHGHTIGDELFMAIAARLPDSLPRGATLARFGGDEFVILLEALTDSGEAEEFAKHLVRRAREPILWGELELFVTVSAGLATCMGSSVESEHLLSDADAAMYRSKETGRDRWMRFDENIRNEAQDRLHMATGLRAALDRNELESYFQPIVDIRSNEVVGLELLSHWPTAADMILPDRFIPIAEASGSIRLLGQWAFKSACNAQRVLDEAFGAKWAGYVSVNVSYRQLERPNLPQSLSQICRELDADPQRIVLEVTESALPSQHKDTSETMIELAQLGFEIAVDDFGTGYSSLSRLSKMPITMLKIDQSFIAPLASGADGIEIVEAITNLARSLHLSVIAEGVSHRNRLGYWPMSV